MVVTLYTEVLSLDFLSWNASSTSSQPWAFELFVSSKTHFPGRQVGVKSNLPLTPFSGL